MEKHGRAGCTFPLSFLEQGAVIFFHFNNFHPCERNSNVFHSPESGRWWVEVFEDFNNSLTALRGQAQVLTPSAPWNHGVHVGALVGRQVRSRVRPSLLVPRQRQAPSL